MRWILILLILLCSCQNAEKDRMVQLVKEWEGKKIIFPLNSIFTIQGRDTVNHYWEDANFRIITYIDSLGCMDCKLQLSRWRDFISEVNYYSHLKVSFLIYFSTKDKSELDYILRRDSFMYPVCIDEMDSFNKLNHFSSDMTFQTFLLDKNNKVIAIGNPVHNPKVKDLYLKIVRGKNIKKKTEDRSLKTIVNIASSSVCFDHFDWEKRQDTTFVLKNIGDTPLVIEDIKTSCGCTTVEFEKEPIRPGDSLNLYVKYKADQLGYFNKKITVYCNAEASPIRLSISGNAQ